MKFTYAAYIELITWLKSRGYKFVTFEEKPDFPLIIVNRHDIDLSLEKAYEIAKIDHSLGIKSTFFILLSSFFYNVLDKKNQLLIKNILELNHEIGLHFDETQYSIDSLMDFEKNLNYEIDILSRVVNKKIKIFSNHRPSDFVLKGLKLNQNLINAYSKENFVDTKYFSDSRMNWREDIYQKVELENYKKIQLNTHPFWYEEVEKNMKDKFIDFIKSYKKHFYNELMLGTRDFDEIISLEEMDDDINGTL